MDYAHVIEAAYGLCQTKILNVSFRNVKKVPFPTDSNLFLKAFMGFELVWSACCRSARYF